MDRRLFVIAACAAALLPLRVSYADRGGGQNRYRDTQSAFFMIRKRMEAEGYSNIVNEHPSQAAPWIHLLATNPDGKRVRAVFDTRGNLLSKNPIAGSR